MAVLYQPVLNISNQSDDYNLMNDFSWISCWIRILPNVISYSLFRMSCQSNFTIISFHLLWLPCKLSLIFAEGQGFHCICFRQISYLIIWLCYGTKGICHVFLSHIRCKFFHQPYLVVFSSISFYKAISWLNSWMNRSVLKQTFWNYLRLKTLSHWSDSWSS